MKTKSTKKWRVEDVLVLSKEPWDFNYDLDESQVLFQKALTSNTNGRLREVLEKVKGIRKEDPNKVPPFPKVQYNHLDILGFNAALDEITNILQAEIDKGV